MNCIVCRSESDGVTLTIYGVRIFVCGECIGKGKSATIKAARAAIKKRAPKVFKALAAAAQISKVMR